MKLVIISGRSGSGKTTALHVLEDIGYYCVDNLPVPLIPETLRVCAASGLSEIALCVDVRVGAFLRRAPEVIEAVADPRLELLFYHFPQISGVPIPHAVIERLLARYPQTIKGIKDSSGDLAHTLSLIRAFPSLAVFAGADQHLLAVLEAGGAGTISAAANLACAWSRTVFNAFERVVFDLFPGLAALLKVTQSRFIPMMSVGNIEISGLL